MATENITVIPSHLFTKALLVNSFATTPFKYLMPSATEPTDDGTWSAGQGGDVCPSRLFVLPYCAGDDGSVFYLRLWGWRLIGQDPNLWVWVPHLLIELSLVAGEIPGPAAPSGQFSPRYVGDQERFCDTIVLTKGSPGDSGEIVNPGPGLDLIAYALIDLKGCQKFQFEFEQGDNVTMNALWARV